MFDNYNSAEEIIQQQQDTERLVLKKEDTYAKRARAANGDIV